MKTTVRHLPLTWRSWFGTATLAASAEAAIPGQGLGGGRRRDQGRSTPSSEAKRGAAHGEFCANRLFERGTAPGEWRLFLPGTAVSANLPPDVHSARARSVARAAQRGRGTRRARGSRGRKE